ncbi:Imm17 family immunity protein [Bacteroides faecium]|jgi:hypothetical protein|uniref:Immunity protein 17 n=1 Tax=Bacteroides faecium TaxID=2715212 RepID=A0A6H0KU09_9BACE|nr:Imm17 family immunity protein [Bacteroides faecium]QIU96679.1 hypothetical protein BacF7301_22130 [Bacteroides faecium]
MEAINSQFFSKLCKEYGYLFIAASGLLILLGAILNWDWVLEGDGRMMNIAWVSNKFGRTVARILVGISGSVLLVIGILMFFLSKL